MKNKLALVSLALVAFGTTSISHIQRADAATILGGVDLAKYCRETHVVYRPTRAVLVGNNAYSWRCRMPLTIFSDWPYWDHGIDMNAVCRRQYNRSSAYARTNNPSSPYSWQCYR
ncbi:MAG: hypothetical protein EAZ87_06815 [Nostocales cyanobacterium]|nr:MAG: hypothetical protein EAZ87_06815 [Nostocales cyanobacterium]